MCARKAAAASDAVTSNFSPLYLPTSPDPHRPRQRQIGRSFTSRRHIKNRLAGAARDLSRKDQKHLCPNRTRPRPVASAKPSHAPLRPAQTRQRSKQTIYYQCYALCSSDPEGRRHLNTTQPKCYEMLHRSAKIGPLPTSWATRPTRIGRNQPGRWAICPRIHANPLSHRNNGFARPVLRPVRTARRCTIPPNCAHPPKITKANPSPAHLPRNPVPQVFVQARLAQIGMVRERGLHIHLTGNGSVL